MELAKSQLRVDFILIESILLSAAAPAPGEWARPEGGEN